MLSTLKKMIDAQASYDQKVLAKFDTSYEEILAKHGYFFAILDEFGEWNHTRKARWGWWQVHKDEPSREMELEEFADILHFCISHDIAIRGHAMKGHELAPQGINGIEDGISKIMSYLESGYSLTLTDVLLDIGQAAGYSMDEIFEAYMAKNKINRERLENGY